MHTIEELEKISLAIFNESTGVRQVNEEDEIQAENPIDVDDGVETSPLPDDDIENDDIEAGDEVMYDGAEWTVDSVDPIDGLLTLKSMNGDEIAVVQPGEVDRISSNDPVDNGPEESPVNLEPENGVPVDNGGVESEPKTGVEKLGSQLNKVGEGKEEGDSVVTESCGKKGKKKSKFFKKNFLFTSDKEKKRKIDEAVKYGYSLAE